MNAAWALRLEPCDDARLVSRLGPLRLRPGLEACADGDGATWVRGATALEHDPELDRLVRASGAARFVVDPTGEVRAPGRRLPAGALPAGPWTPLRAWLRPAPGAARTTALPGGRVTLALRRAPGPEVEPTALVVARDVFVRWALSAPQVRLARLEVAARADRPAVLVRGAPLPPLPGERLVVTDGVAVPSGWTVWPALDAATLREVLGVGEGDLGVLTVVDDGAAGGAPTSGHTPAAPATFERVDARWFAPASRALARALGAAP